MGCKYGSHRVLEPKGVLPQPALRLDNDFSTIAGNEILVDVRALNIDSASFTQIEEEAGGDLAKIAAKILAIVAERGKMQNPVTGSGGMFIGTVAKVGAALAGRDLKAGDRIASLVSLSLTPLKIERIVRIHPEIDRVEVVAQAVLFESGIYAKLPADMDETLALAALDVAGAPAQAAKLVRPGQSVLILGAGGKSGMLVAWEAMKRVGPTGRVVGNVYLAEDAATLADLDLCHEVVVADATKPVALMEAVLAANGGAEYDVVFNCVNVQNTELSSILPCRQEGTVYFFSMATHFGKAALGAEGVGKDVTMIVGNGYTKGHAEITLAELRENAKLRRLFETRYA
ncbi:MAG: L-erythro-3,5-diaminohexanoate dehydrogenase [Holophagales bacterium]|nr:L-erythro-3,5-diaminohexanoate dehydrogenase [Holophagales bacterium]MBK9965163.1 L-erythro-3,5-diaminohexanoate dehydrogenase [Holophagales bacterium]